MTGMGIGVFTAGAVLTDRWSAATSDPPAADLVVVVVAVAAFTTVALAWLARTHAARGTGRFETDVELLCSAGSTGSPSNGLSTADGQDPVWIGWRDQID
jgi:hypothetical protein